MSEMIERVARAILRARGSRATAELIWDDNDPILNKAATEARAAIEAMREPLSRHLAAALSSPVNRNYEGRRMDDPNAWSAILQDIIDAELSEKP